MRTGAIGSTGGDTPSNRLTIEGNQKGIYLSKIAKQREAQPKLPAKVAMHENQENMPVNYRPKAKSKQAKHESSTNPLK